MHYHFQTISIFALQSALKGLSMYVRLPHLIKSSRLNYTIMRYLCVLYIRKKFLRLLYLIKKKLFCWVLSGLSIRSRQRVNNNRFEKLNIQDLFAIYTLLYSQSFNFFAAFFKALRSWSKQLYLSINRLKLQNYYYLTIQNISLIYTLPFLCNFDFCAATLTLFSWSKRILEQNEF